MIEDGKVHRTSIAGGNGADEGAGAIITKGAGFADNAAGFFGRIQPIAQRALVDAGHRQNINERVAGTGQFGF